HVILCLRKIVINQSPAHTRFFQKMIYELRIFTHRVLCCNAMVATQMISFCMVLINLIAAMLYQLVSSDIQGYPDGSLPVSLRTLIHK
ncbi:hypothetical protein PMAYCL1PPCAC_08447, partial [Pristionchus mayeri]